MQLNRYFHAFSFKKGNKIEIYFVSKSQELFSNYVTKLPLIQNELVFKLRN